MTAIVAKHFLSNPPPLRSDILEKVLLSKFLEILLVRHLNASQVDERLIMIAIWKDRSFSGHGEDSIVKFILFFWSNAGECNISGDIRPKHSKFYCGSS